MVLNRALLILAIITALGGMALAVAALRSGWMLPWLRGHQPARTSGIIWLGVSAACLLNTVPDLLGVPAQVRDVLPLVGMVVLAGSVVVAYPPGRRGRADRLQRRAP